MGTTSLVWGFQAPASMLGSLEAPILQGLQGPHCGNELGSLRPRYPHSSAVLPTSREEILPIRPFYYRFGLPGNVEPRWEENQAFNLKGCNGILSCPLNYSATSILNVWFISSKMICTLLINHPYFTTNMPQVVQQPECLDWNNGIFWSSAPEPGGSCWCIWYVRVLWRWGMGCLGGWLVSHLCQALSFCMPALRGSKFQLCSRLWRRDWSKWKFIIFLS